MQTVQRINGFDFKTFKNDDAAIELALQLSLKSDADTLVICGIDNLQGQSGLHTILNEAYMSGHSLMFVHTIDEAPADTSWSFPDPAGYKGISFRKSIET